MEGDDHKTLGPLVIIVGPTAVGKSRLALHLAEILGTEIISADSRQVYRGLDIGTDKPSPEDRHRIPHHLIDVVDPWEIFDAGRFQELADQVITRLHREGKIPLVVGGTGMYIRVLVDGLCPAPKADPSLRERLLEVERREGVGTLWRRLQEVDPAAARRIQPRDYPRVLRALEVYHLTGVSLSSLQVEWRSGRPRYRARFLGLTMDRATLYRRIEARVDAMVARGLEEEVRRLVAQGLDERYPAMRGLGYAQWLGYFRGEYSREEAIRRLKRDTRRYAKRQWTWFRRDPRIQWWEITPETDLAELARTLARALEEERGS